MSPWANPKSVMTRFSRKKKIWMSCAFAKASTRMPGRLVIATPETTCTEQKYPLESQHFIWTFKFTPTLCSGFEPLTKSGFFVLIFTGRYLLHCPCWPWPPLLSLCEWAEHWAQRIWSYGTQTPQRCPQPVDSIGKTRNYLTKVERHFNVYQYIKGKICV